jgi:hypothetical protein
MEPAGGGAETSSPLPLPLPEAAGAPLGLVRQLAAVAASRREASSGAARRGERERLKNMVKTSRERATLNA